MTEMVATVVTGMGLGCVHLHGGVASHKRGELMERFEKEDAVQVFISTDAGGVGLNLQSATVLINLDMPWNPAVLDQRIARVHRLGQKEKVQIFLLLAEDSYEQRVASLVKGKRDLFDNVVNPEAQEDVVGVSKKMLETLVDDLLESPAAKVEEIPGEDTTTPIVLTQEAPSSVKQQDVIAEQDVSVNALIVKVQDAFKQRIQRIMGAGGGLLVVLDAFTEADEQLAEALSQPGLPVVAMAAHALRSLQRLGAASPLAHLQVLVEPISAVTVTINPLFKRATDTLHAAELLLQQGCTAGVMELLAASMLAKATALAQQAVIPATDQVSVWLYGELLPQHTLTGEQVAAIVRVMALSQSHQVPDALIAQCLEDARVLCAA
ncbi:MAG: helicase-related protein [Methylococcaceae bacterium]